MGHPVGNVTSYAGKNSSILPEKGFLIFLGSSLHLMYNKKLYIAFICLIFRWKRNIFIFHLEFLQLYEKFNEFFNNGNSTVICKKFDFFY